GSAPKVSLNTNLIFTEKPDLFYSPRMDNSDFVEVERMLFDRGYYKNSENSNSKTALSPVVETLIAQRDGVISSDEAEKRVAGYKTHDVRSELQNIYYRPRLSQQYSLGIAGGGTHNTYAVSAGYDRTDENVVGNSRERITINAKNSWLFMDNKLDANLGLYFTGSGVTTATELPSPYSYDYLQAANGNHLPITQGYSRRYIAGDLPAGLLDWNYIPLDELGTLENTSRASDLRVNVGLGYKIFPGFRVSLSHQYWQNSSSQRNYQLAGSYFVRDLVNQFSQLDPDGGISRPIPEGGIEDIGSNVGLSHNFRAQLNYDKVFGKNQLTVLGGYEAKSLRREGNQTRYYGYEEELGISRQVDYITRFRRFHNNSLASIPAVDAHSGTVDNFISGYFNSSFTFDKKLVFNASMRRDASNLFGVRANQKAIPLWSAGASWVLSEEGFLADWNLPFVRLRTTYGYNGNVDRSVSAFATAQYVSGGPFSLIPSLPYAVVSSPPNPDLRWERIGILNFGVDVETTDGRLRTSLEYYVKRGTDLLGDFPVAASTGLRQFRGNFANTLTKGFDFEVSTVNTQGQIKWDTRLFVSYVNEKVTDYEREFSATSALLGTSGAVPLPGKPLFSVLSIPFAGLDPANGNPLGYLDGEASDDYSAIISSLTAADLQYHGPSRPTVFGTVTNNLSWKNLSLSFNITYRLGYYYRRQTVNYGDLLAGRISHSDYALRWMNPGDEAVTDVPSMPEANNNNRNTLILYGSNLVEKGDHVRLQDIRLSYGLNQKDIHWLPFQNAEIYAYADNLGILWKASRDRFDPDYRSSGPMRSISFGLRIGF
ncbi:SusC/RagA family TonB-linked outer membrane protein, partial [Algoriphagus sp. D3-2-R+10]|uniref:SusC/RagA family TonB-linked outer membrane protein n=1 Tax=Algoriphagus aurantiacus TaxID=3103948 RepID=UPI002B3F9214